MLITGITMLVLAIANKNYFTSRGWAIVGGILDIILGIILCCNIGLSATSLPFILAFWFLYRGFMLIAFGSDLSSFGVSGSAWTIVGGVLLLLCSIIILIKPFGIGVPMVTAMLSVGFLFTGIFSCYTAFQLKNIHKHTKEILK